MVCAAGIIGGVALPMDHLEDTETNRHRSFRLELVGDRARSLLGGAVTIGRYPAHPVSQVRPAIKILRQSIGCIYRRSMRIFPGIGCRHLRRYGESVDMDCLRHENGLLWLGGWRQLATPDDVIARFVPKSLNDRPGPVLTVIGELDGHRGIPDRVAVDGRRRLR